jgi:hypothetical protein
MKTLRFTAFSLAALVGLSASAPTARADHDHFGFDAIDELASHVQAHTRDLAIEIRRQLPGDPQYRHAVADVNLVYRQAAKIHSLIHAGVSPTILCREVRTLDAQVHHLEETLSAVRSGHSHFDPWHHSHVWHGPDLRKIRRLMSAIESDTHALMDEVHTLEQLAAGPSITFRRPGISISFGR